MSKSKGNVVNPMEISQKHGADALRMALVIRSSAGLDKSLSEGDFKAARNLSNKLWNASRFILLSREENDNRSNKVGQNDREFEKRIKSVVAEITKNIEALQLGVASDRLYDEFWHWFCDECIEENKKGLIGQDLLLEGLKVFLKLFHPFMPFVTEAIWQELVKEGLSDEKILASSPWPVLD